ncbi:DUF5916 domain-containing protein [Massilia sp. W12]|uniref:carbohydrate binding family 9 domain-containing protein n=1 Tax=Massilia sp. W12 TaxID=3126507 RepID=UPI0030D01EF2
MQRKTLSILQAALALALPALAGASLAQTTAAPAAPASAPAADSDNSKLRLKIPRAAKAPVLADYIGKLPAEPGLEVKDFRQNEPGDGLPAANDTRVYLSYDDEHLYAVYICKDDPRQIRARIAKREDLFGDDAVILDIDTFHDKQRSYRFYINPYGVQLDGKYTEGQGLDLNFDTQWKSDGRITDDGYVVSVAIPFKSLRFARGASQDWGISFGRITARLNEFAYWPYITKRKEGFVSQFASLDIPSTVSPGRNIQLIPYISQRSSKLLNPDYNPPADPSQPGNSYFERQNKTRAGLDAKFVLADAFAVDLTYNPDFSEVESDEPQVVINQRYESLFPEKRPFFLENAGFFNSPKSLFFSRRISDPKLGARITGRTGPWSIGALVIDDNGPGRQLMPGAKDYGKKAHIAVGRVQRDFADDSNAGLLLTRRSMGDNNNTVASADVRYKINQNWVFSAQGARSETEGNHLSGKINGHLLFLDLTRSDRDFNYNAQYLDISRDFDTALSYLPRTSIKQINQTASYAWFWENQPFLRSVTPSWNMSMTQEGERLQDWNSKLGLSVSGARATNFELYRLDGRENFFGETFFKHGWLASANTEWLDWLTASVSIGRNDVLNYAWKGNANSMLGLEHSYTMSLKITPHPQWRLEQALYWNDLRTKDGRDEAIYRQLLARTKLSYQHSRFAAVRLIMDYSNLQANPAHSLYPSGKRLNTDLQYSYILSPGTTLYVGYTDIAQSQRLENGRLQATPNLDLHTGRQAYVKFSYLFQY